MTRFAYLKDFKESIVRTLEYTTIDGMYFKSEFPTQSWNSLNPEVVVLHPLPEYGDVFPISDDSQIGYADGDEYWCIEINGCIYMTRIGGCKPDWATHYIYFSK
jgi:hypothetical protein